MYNKASTARCAETDCNNKSQINKEYTYFRFSSDKTA